MSKLISSERLPWDEFYMNLSKVIGRQSTCPKKHVGAILIHEKSRRIISTGYNGVPRGIRHLCEDEQICYRDNEDTKNYSNCPVVHAEVNCITQAAYHGISTENTVLYCEYMSCHHCCEILINAGIKGIIFEKAPVDSFAIPISIEAGVELYRLKDGKKVRIGEWKE